MAVPMIVGVVGGVAARRLTLYVIELNNKRQAKVLIEVREQQMIERQAARQPYVMNDDFSYSDHSGEILGG
jgi:hypothetical protein